MSVVRIVALNLNPCIASDETLDNKEAMISKVFESYRIKLDPEAEAIGIFMASFNPRESSYTSFVKEWISGFGNYYKTEFVLIIQSLFDIANKPKTAYNQLQVLLKNPRIMAIYFTNYSLDSDVSFYIDDLREAFQIEKSSKPKPDQTNSYPDYLRKYIVELHNNIDDPINISAISKATGIPEGSIKSICSRANKNKVEIRGDEGRGLKDEEETKLLHMMKKRHHDIMNSAVLRKERIIMI